MINKLRTYFVVLPVAYLLVSIFLLRNDVLYVYIASAVLVVIALIVQRGYKQKPDRFLAHWLIVLAAIGLCAAVILSIEKITLLANPNYIASCSISPVVACSPVIGSPQASALGFPNSFIGIFGFSAVLVAGMTILAGATKLNKVWWRTLLAGTISGAAFSSWLIYQGVFTIGKLCLYCMAVWLVTFALLWLTAAYCVENKSINLGSRVNGILKHKYELILTTYVIIFAIIFYRWSDYWLGLF